MKKYLIKSREIASDPAFCEEFLDKMVKEGFELVQMKSGGTFCFEYSEKRHKYRYYCVPGAAAAFFNHRLNSVTFEIKRIFPSAEIANIGTAMRIIRLDYRSSKEKTYLDHIAREYGLDEFTEDGYLEKVKEKRDKLIKSGANLLIVIMAIFALMFISFGFIVWWTAFIAILPLISIFSSVKILANLKKK